MTQHLSSDLKVACEIWHYNQLDEPIWIAKLVENLKGHMDKDGNFSGTRYSLRLDDYLR